MSENNSKNRYYWLKLVDTFFQRQDIKIIESQENGAKYVMFYLKLLLKSITYEGVLRINEKLPFTDKTLAAITDTDIDIVRSAMILFEELNLVDVLEDSTIFMNELPKMIGSESESAERVRRHRAKKKEQLEEPQKEQSLQCNKNVTVDIRDKNKDIRDKDNNTPHTPLGVGSVDDKKVDILDNDVRFKAFWEIYPKHTSVETAYQQFEKLNLDDDTYRTLISCLKKQCNSIEWQREQGRFIPAPSRYLREKKWQDELTYPVAFEPVAIDENTELLLDKIFKKMK